MEFSLATFLRIHYTYSSPFDMIRIIAAVILLCSVALSAHASTVWELDNSGNYTTATWTNGSNGGTNFGSWTFTTSGSGSKGTFIGNTGDVGSNPTFGIFADTNNNITVSRSFTGGAMTAGQTFSFNMGSTGVNNSAQIGFQLLSGSSIVYTFLFTGGQSVWQANDGNSNFNTSVSYFNNDSVTLSFTYNGGNNYTVNATEPGSSSYTCSGCNATNNLSNITGFQFFDFGQGSGQNFGFDDLSLVPEVSPVWSGTLALLATVLFMRRRRIRAASRPASLRLLLTNGPAA